MQGVNVGAVFMFWWASKTKMEARLKPMFQNEYDIPEREPKYGKTVIETNPSYGKKIVKVKG